MAKELTLIISQMTCTEIQALSGTSVHSREYTPGNPRACGPLEKLRSEANEDIEELAMRLERSHEAYGQGF